jgi:hypothetical protein
VYFDDNGMDEEMDGKKNFNTMRFGLLEIPKSKDQKPRKLTYSKYGKTNSTVLRIGGKDKAHEFLLGDPNSWKMVGKPEKLGEHGGMKTIWQSTGQSKIQVTQLVEIVPGEPVEIKGKAKRYFDTCRIRYIIENKGTRDVVVGLRVLIDTLIGVDRFNDGVPFIVPGQKALMTTTANFQPAGEVPDFIQVLENYDLNNPGLIGFMNFKIGGGAEAPSRLLLTHWDKDITKWDIPQAPIGDDSAVVVYWEEKKLPAGEKREVGFSYGLGSLSITTNGRLGINVGGSLVKDSDMTVVALVSSPKSGEQLTLKLPAGLKLIEGEAKQTVPPVPAGAAAQQSPVTWRIRAERAGIFTIEVHSSSGGTQKKNITIRTKTIF